ncbi:hypothetical protein CRYUN_Cryun33cG0041300 [Craigia yunnanensis]
MSSLSIELVFLILQFLDEEKFKDTVHILEQESGFFFNSRYFEDMVINGEWDEVEKYLSGFTKVDDNRYSMKIFFEIRKQKYLEALDNRDLAKAVEILVKDLKVFSAFNEDLFKEIIHLLTLQNFRENEQLSKYGDTKSARGIMLAELKKLIETNPLFHDKLQFPTLKNSRLRTLINQSLNWQHQLCKNPRPNPDIKTLFVDHSCGQPNGARAPSPVANALMGAVIKAGGFPPLGAHGPFQPMPAALPTSLSGWMANATPVPHPAASAGPIGLTAPNNAAAILKRPRTPPTNNPALDYQSADSEHVLTRSRPFGMPDEINNLPVNILPVPYAGLSHGQSSYSPDDLPKTVVMTLSQGSAVKSMDFHPVQQILLFVGTNIGDIMVWEVGSGEKIAHKTFKVWDLSACSMPLQASLANDYTVSVNRVMWSPDGALFDLRFSLFHVLHTPSISCTYTPTMVVMIYIEAHVGSVNDLAFSYPNKQPCVVTCGEDRVIKVWDAATGAKQYAFEGHEAPVYSICPHHKENIQFIFSTATDGKIKAWLYDNMGSRVDYNAPGQSSTTMAYSANGTRLFSCGTNKEGESYLVEWNESEGAVKRTLLRTVENRSFDASRVAPAVIVKAPNIGTFGSNNATIGTAIGVRTAPVAAMVGMNSDSQSLADVKPRIADESLEKSRMWKLTEINEPSQCRSLRLPDCLTAMRATTNVAPQLWQPSSGILMTNDKSDTNPEDAVPCFALSKNDSYVMSASEGKISLFNMMTFKTMTTFMPPPPPATFLAFHPQDNNIIAIGMDDSSIQIYNVRVDEMKTKLKGHQKRITGLAFSHSLNVLVSSGADSQWISREASGPITHATYSCDSQSIYVSFEDGSVDVLTASTLRLRCRISPAAYLPPNPSLRVFPLVIAAHPSDPNQFALGLTDGGVHIIEPSESEGKWDTSPPVENGAGPSTTSGATGAEPPQR